MTRLLQTMGGLTGRGPSVGGPAGFRVQQPLKWQLCGNTQCQQLADYRHSPHHAIEMINRPVSSFERGTSNGQNSRNRVTKQAAQLVSSSGALV